MNNLLFNGTIEGAPIENQPNHKPDPRAMAKLPVDARGYIRGFECPKTHSGNRRYKQDGAWCACGGCGNFRSTVSLWEELKLVSKPTRSE